MRILLATLRRRPAPLIGTLVSLTVAALLVTIVSGLVGTAITMTLPAGRLAGAAVVVTGNPNMRFTYGTGQGASTDTVPLPAYRRVPAGLAARLAELPGVARAIPQVSVPVALELPGGRVVTGGPAGLTGYGWPSAALTPFTLDSGHAPTGPGQIVVGAGVARSAGLRTGDQVRLAGASQPPYTVVGVASSGRNPAQNSSVFWSAAQADAEYGHPGSADLIGVIARRGTTAAALAARVRAALASPPLASSGLAGGHLSVAAGTARGPVADLAAAPDKDNLSLLALNLGIIMVIVSMFVVAGAVSLSVLQRRRQFALLRAVGASSGRLRRMMIAELGVLGILGALIAYLPGVRLSSLALHGLAGQQFVPAGTRLWTSPLVLLIAAGAGVLVAELAGFVAGRRASRVRPTEALAQASVERRWPHPVRVGLGIIALGGAVALGVATLSQNANPSQQASNALLTLLVSMVAVAFLGPLLVAAAELIVRLPLRLLAGAAGRLALGDIRVRPRRMAASVVSAALAVSFAGTIYLIDATGTHAAVVQGRQRLVAEEAMSAPGPGLAPGVLADAAARRGVATAIGLTPTTVLVPAQGGESASGEAVTPGPLGEVLSLPVIAGSLAHFRPGDIALSNMITGSGGVNAHVGERITSYLADGTRYRATVAAIYSRSLGFGDVLIPAGAAGGGHLGTPALGEILVHGSAGIAPATLARRIAPLARRFPGLQVASRSVVNAQYTRLTSQNSYLNNLLLGLIITLAAVTLANTLITIAVERREPLRLLSRVGATSRQLLAVTGWQVVVLNATAITVGAGAGALAVTVVSRVLTGSYLPYLTWTPLLALAISVLALSGLSSMGPTALILARREGA
jgi:putative ABC transport system permease protein